jgi:hypothetical protein
MKKAKMKILNSAALVIAVAWMPHSTLAAPRCEGVLLSQEYTSEQIQKTIADIAKLRFSVDMAAARGVMSSAERNMAFQANKKLKSLAESLDGILSPEQIREAIASEIEFLQKGKVRESIAREEQKEALSAPFVLDREIRVNEEFIGRPLIPILGGSKVLFQVSSQPKILDLMTEKVSDFGVESIYSYRLLNDSMMVAIDKTGQVYEFDLRTQAAKKLARLTEKIGIFPIKLESTAMSPDGKTIAVRFKGKIKFYDSMTGQALSHSFIDPSSPSSWFRQLIRENTVDISYRFLTNSLVYIESSFTRRLYDINTGEVKVLKIKDVIARTLAPVGDGSTLVCNDKYFVYTIAAKDLAEFDTKAEMFFDLSHLDHEDLLGSEVWNFKMMPGQGSFFMTRNMGQGGFYDMNTAQLLPEYAALDFTKFLSFSDPIIMDGKLYLMTAQRGNVSALQIWKRR